jgi:hypothetical protein
MPPVYTSTEIDARLAVVQSAIDAGGSNGLCKFYDGGNNLLATLNMQGPPCGSVAGGVLTFATPWTAAQASATGTPVTATISDSNNNVAISGLTVGTGSSAFDIVMSEPQLTVGKTVIIQTATITGH